MGLYDGNGRCPGMSVEGHAEGGRTCCVAEDPG